VNRDEHVLIALEWKLDAFGLGFPSRLGAVIREHEPTVATVSPARARTERMTMEVLRKARGFAITLMS
jgi:hypothetical protein